jgi:hypothetical protein
MTVILCANCHAALSDAQRDHPRSVGGTPSTFERIGRWLLNLADFLCQLACKFREFGALLLQSTGPLAPESETIL